MTPSAPPTSESACLTRKLHCEVITDFGRLEQLAPAWLDLLRRSSAPEPMLSPLWLRCWWQVYGQGTNRQLRVGLVYEGDCLIGLAPLQLRRHWYRFSIAFRRLESLGADGSDRDGVYSEYLNFIAEHGKEEAVLGELKAALFQGRLGAWDELILPAMDGNHAMAAMICEVFQGPGLSTVLAPTSEAPYIPLPPTWQQYLEKLGRHRRFLLKSLRDFDAWSEGRATYHLAQTPEQLQIGKRILQELHAERWQAAGKDGVFRAGRFARFHNRVMPLLLELGALELRWLSVGERPLAAIYNIRWNNKIYFYQSGRTLDLPPNIRAGIVLHAHCIRQAIADGCREYDFLEGVSQYKQQLALSSRPIVQFRLTKGGWRERTRRLASAIRAYAR
jgi:CelD/BcsL family acetyltransferase involved in cellulose biosynthesis